MPAGADAAGLAGRAGLTQLPPELRLQIFAFLLRCRGTLQRRSTVATEWLKTGVPASLSDVSHDQRVTLGAVDPSPFLLCKKLRDEALDVFYDLNRFKIHFNHLCTCHGRFNVAAFDESRIRHLDLYDFYPRQNEKAVCAMCERSGLGLFDYLNRLPRLQLVTVAFEDFMSITDFVQSSRTCGVRLEASEVGCFQVAGPRLTIELRMPLMNQAWRNLITMNGGQSENLEKPPGEESVRHALEYLQFEANDWGRVPTSLYEYFVVDNIDGMAVSRLGLKDQPNGSQRILAFTVDLAEVLGDLFIEDCMTESLQWKYIGLPETLRWDFRQGMISV